MLDSWTAIFNFFYYILVHCSLYLCMLATDIEEIMHSKLCVTHVYLRDIINTFFFSGCALESE